MYLLKQQAKLMRMPTRMPGACLNGAGLHWLEAAGIALHCNISCNMFTMQGDFEEGQGKRIPSGVLPGVLRFCKALLCLGLHLRFVTQFPVELLESSWFAGIPFLQRCGAQAVRVSLLLLTASWSSASPGLLAAHVPRCVCLAMFERITYGRRRKACSQGPLRLDRPFDTCTKACSMT